MEKKLNLLDVIMIFLLILLCFAIIVAMIMGFSENENAVVYRISVGDDTAEIIKQGDILYDESGNAVGKVISIGSLGKQKAIYVKADTPDIFRVGELVELKTQRIFLKGTVYSVSKAEEAINEK